MIQRRAAGSFFGRHEGSIMKQNGTGCLSIQDISPHLTPNRKRMPRAIPFCSALGLQSYVLSVLYGQIMEFSHVTSSQIADQIEKQLTPKEIKEELIQVWKAL